MPSNNSPNRPGSRTNPNPPSRGGGSNPASPQPTQPSGTQNNIAETLSFADFKRGQGPSEVLSYPRDLKGGASSDTDYVRFIFKEYSPPFRAGQVRGNQGGYNTSIVGLKNTDGLSKIFLYMPEDIQAQYGAQWGGKSIQMMTGGILQALGNASEGDLMGLITDPGDRLGSVTESAFTKGVSTILENLQKTGQGEGLGINDVLGSTTGVVLNPNTELLFQGFDLRTFNLTFKMVARNGPEAIEIKQIITNFKRAMLPKIDTGNKTKTSTPAAENGQTNQRGQTGSSQDTAAGAGDVQNFIGVPSLVEVSFMKGSGENPYVTQFKPCAITSLNVNYTPDGAYSTYSDGAPVAVVMQIGFAETKLIYREDIYDQGPSY